MTHHKDAPHVYVLLTDLTPNRGTVVGSYRSIDLAEFAETDTLRAYKWGDKRVPVVGERAFKSDTEGAAWGKP